MNEAASNRSAGEERPRLIIAGLVVWVLLQLPRLIAIPLIQDVLEGTESDAWMFPAILDVVVAVAAPSSPSHSGAPVAYGSGSPPWSSSSSPSSTTWTR
jgi:hypothetical protein